jgi:hypothetical protein
MDYVFDNTPESTLPIDIVYYILVFDTRFVMRNGKLIEIKRLAKEDERYSMLSKRPTIQFHKHHFIQFSFAYLRNRQNRVWYLLDVEIQDDNSCVITLRRTIYSKDKSPLPAGWIEEDDGKFAYRKCEYIMR